METRALIRYDGKYEARLFSDPRSYTIVNHYVNSKGRDLFRCTFTGAAVLLKALRGEI